MVQKIRSCKVGQAVSVVYTTQETRLTMSYRVCISATLVEVAGFVQQSYSCASPFTNGMAQEYEAVTTLLRVFGTDTRTANKQEVFINLVS